ncbi:MAG TPA: hypothetical protein VFX20_09475 [Steroidobacteraceae bacterium]|nr:hypothetical protein [Steroidobacteraceae bacterium]
MTNKWVLGLLELVAASALLCAAPSVGAGQQPVASPAGIASDFLQGLRWRSIGPTRGGRAPAVAGDPKHPLIFYMGTEGGGVWKTYDAGRYWQNVSDPYFKTSSIGAIAVAPSDPKVIYVGTGETSQHVDIQAGDGVYKSTDGGATWVNVGLQATRHIARILVSPRDPNLVYVAAFGHEFSNNPERGVYRSRDGGQTWQKILYVSDRAGAVDLSMDPSDPGVIYAAIWQFVRKPWSETSGGPDSGLYKTTDGGDHWTNISHNPGLPAGILGKIGVSVSASRPSRVYAVVEARHGGLFRSDDSGATWHLMNQSRSFLYMAFWYMHVVADPQDPDTVYVPQVTMWKSTDGGHTLEAVRYQHGDNHALWIDPANNRRMIEGNDGGAIVTLNGGDSWSTEMNQPTEEMFKMAVDDQYPYRVYGTPMDNDAVSCPSETMGPAIEWKDCYTVGSAESGFIAPQAGHPDIVVAGAVGSSEGGGGNLYRYDVRSGQQRMITVWPEDQYQSPEIDVKYRFYFTFPVFFSPHDPNTLYAAAQYVFRSRDLGSSWQVISPDLTNDDKSRMMRLDGPISSQKLSSQYISTIYSLAESPIKAGELWAGSDDGSVHYSPDGGKTWLDRSPKDLPKWTGIYSIEVSSHDPGTVYIAPNRHELSDHTPYFEMTTDYGKTWHRIDNGIPDGAFGWVIREDPVRRGLLYAGTEGGVFVSFDDGTNWQSLRRNMPVVAVRDMRVKNDDLIAATHGRAFWILDGLHVLREITPEVAASSVHLFTVPLTYRLMGPGFDFSRLGAAGNRGPAYVRILEDGIALHETRQADGSVAATYLNAGSNPPKGVVVTYYLKQKPNGPVTLTFMDSQGKTIQQFSGTSSERFGPQVSAAPGTNRFVWDMIYPNARQLSQADFAAEERGDARAAVAVPGTYKVRLSVGGEEYQRSFVIREDPRVHVTQQDLQAQFDLMMKLDAEIDKVTDTVHRIQNARAQVAAVKKQAQGHPRVAAAADKLDAALKGVESNLVRMVDPAHPMYMHPKTVNMRLQELTTVVESADAAPTSQSYDVFNLLSGQTTDALKALKPMLDEQLPALLKMAGRR